MSADIIEIEPARLWRMQTLHVQFVLLDLRTEESYALGHIRNAINVPSNEFLKRLPQMLPKKDTPVVSYDQDGIEAANLVAQAEAQGFINVVNLQGGYAAYKEAYGAQIV